MNKNRLIQWISLGVLGVGVVALAQQKAQVPPVSGDSSNLEEWSTGRKAPCRSARRILRRKTIRG